MWSLVAHQLEIARALAELDKRRPRQASLRRAVSTAYYALFQALCATSAETLVGWAKPWEVFNPIYRSLEHRRTLSVLMERGNDGKHPFGDAIERVGNAFKELQAAREWADYNPEPRPSYEATKNASPFARNEAIALIELADEAVKILDRLDDEARLKLAIRLVTKARK